MHNFSEQFEQVKNLLDQLAEIGKTHYKKEYQDTISLAKKIGASLTYSDLSANAIFDIAYEYLEDFNYHSACSVIDWIKNNPSTYYENDLDRVIRMISKDNIPLHKIDQDENRNWKIFVRNAKVTVSVEWLNDWTLAEDDYNK